VGFVSVIHIILAVIVIILVLIQDSKGGALGAFSGGTSSNSILGPTGTTSFLSNLTKWIVVGFAITSLILTNLTSNKGGSALDKMAQPAAATPAAPQNAPAAAAPVEASPAESAPAKK
jgi:preprotein translocase subunit SecG